MNKKICLSNIVLVAVMMTSGVTAPVLAASGASEWLTPAVSAMATTAEPAPTTAPPDALPPASPAPTSTTPTSTTPESTTPESTTPESTTPESTIPETTTAASNAAAPDPAAPVDDSAVVDLMLESQRHALSQSINSPAGVSFHKNMYIAPLSYAEDYNGLQTEVVFQLSFKARLFGGPLFFGYTQRSYWQAYDKDNSSPFRETNYNPEVFARFQPDEWWSDQWGIDLGIEHESNGREVPDSRSWNRLYTMVFHEGEHDMLSIKAWYRLKEDPKPDTRSAEGDDNPDILDYYGYGELRYRRCLDGARCLQLFESMLRGNTSTGKGAVELMWSFPAESEQMSWFVALFSGYGESLIDYDNHQNRIMVGVTLRPH